MREAILKLAPPYDQEELDLIVRGFEKRLGKTVDFQVVEDPSLIGGFLAQVDGKIYDYSFSTQLRELHHQLLEHLGGEDNATV
ncbi:MAG: F0F1 ATP synthase subunit delta [Oscillospiraceae bacterium]|jgi:F0F1-type ATP synthase delta subunit